AVEAGEPRILLRSRSQSTKMLNGFPSWEWSCEKIAKTDGRGGRASPRAALGRGLPDNRLAGRSPSLFFHSFRGKRRQALGRVVVRGMMPAEPSAPALSAKVVAAPGAPFPRSAGARPHLVAGETQASHQSALSANEASGNGLNECH